MAENDDMQSRLLALADEWEAKAKDRSPAPGEWHSDMSYVYLRDCAKALREVVNPPEKTS